MQTFILEAEKKEQSGKSISKKIRSKGWVPAVIYGSGTESTLVSIPAKPLEKILKTGGKNSIIQLQIKGAAEEKVLPYIITKNALTQRLSHIDFLRITDSTMVKVNIPIHLEGTAPGVKMGGALFHAITHIEIKCLPTSIPQEIRISVDQLNIGDRIRVENIEEKGFSILTEKSNIVASVEIPKVEKVKEETPGAVVAEAKPEAEKADAKKADSK